MAKQQLSPRTLIEQLGSLIVGGHRVTVHVKDVGIDVDPSTMGVYSPLTTEITLDGRLPDALLVKVLLHEVIHAAIDTQSIILPDEVEEKTVRVITAGLFATLMANPRLAGVLMIMAALTQGETARTEEARGTTNSPEPDAEVARRQPRKKKAHSADDHHLGFRARATQSDPPHQGGDGPNPSP